MWQRFLSGAGWERKIGFFWDFVEMHKHIHAKSLGERERNGAEEERATNRKVTH